MNELKRDSQDRPHIWEQMCRAEFKDKSVIAQWGNQRQYIILDVVFDSNPRTKTFQTRDGTMSNVADYFKKVYQKIVTQANQPLLKVKAGDTDAYLPSEFCLLDGVSDSIRASPLMRDALKETRTTPDEKI